ncbi:MAG: hypothetical protein IKK92_10215 [Prevotella sp.]|nr:hypothetical protein [Prevotella sp.]
MLSGITMLSSDDDTENTVVSTQASDATVCCMVRVTDLCTTCPPMLSVIGHAAVRLGSC